MRLIPSVVSLGPPTLRGFLARIAPHPGIRKLREIVYLLYDTHKSMYQQKVHAIAKAENSGAREGTCRDMISALSECSVSFRILTCDTCHKFSRTKALK